MLQVIERACWHCAPALRRSLVGETCGTAWHGRDVQGNWSIARTAGARQVQVAGPCQPQTEYRKRWPLTATVAFTHVQHISTTACAWSVYACAALVDATQDYMRRTICARHYGAHAACSAPLSDASLRPWTELQLNVGRCWRSAGEKAGAPAVCPEIADCNTQKGVHCAVIARRPHRDTD